MTTMERIVVGGDYTPAGTAALKWAVAEAARTGACVSVVHAFDVAGRADLPLDRDLPRTRRDARYRTQSWVVEVVGELDTSVPMIVSTPDGSAEEALTAAASGARMVVVGEPKHGEHRDLPANLARSCACPVLTVSPDHEAVTA